MSKEQFQTRLDSDMAERVEEYRDEHELTSAEAVRRLVAAGIEDESEPTREQIAADLELINESVDEIAADLDNLRDELDESDDEEFEDMAVANNVLREARQTGTLPSILIIGMLAFLVAAEVGLL